MDESGKACSAEKIKNKALIRVQLSKVPDMYILLIIYLSHFIFRRRYCLILWWKNQGKVEWKMKILSFICLEESLLMFDLPVQPFQHLSEKLKISQH